MVKICTSVFLDSLGFPLWFMETLGFFTYTAKSDFLEAIYICLIRLLQVQFLSCQASMQDCPELQKTCMIQATDQSFRGNTACLHQGLPGLVSTKRMLTLLSMNLSDCPCSSGIYGDQEEEGVILGWTWLPVPVIDHCNKDRFWLLPATNQDLLYVAQPMMPGAIMWHFLSSIKSLCSTRSTLLAFHGTLPGETELSVVAHSRFIHFQ